MNRFYATNIREENNEKACSVLFLHGEHKEVRGSVREKRQCRHYRNQKRKTPRPIQPLDKDMAAYGRLVLFLPVWTDNPPSFVNAVLEELPTGKTIAVKMVSASGKSNCKEKLEARIKANDNEMESFEDVKS